MFAKVRDIGGRGVPLVVVVVLLVCVGGGTAGAARLITGKQVKDSSLTGKDVKDKTLTGKDVKDKSIQPQDLASSIKLGNGTVVNAPGEPGPPGQPGAPGSNAFGELVYRVAGPFDSNGGQLNGGSVECGEGLVAIGGGAYGDADNSQAISASGPSTAGGNVDPSRWQVWMYNSGGDSTFSVYAICARADKVTTP